MIQLSFEFDVCFMHFPCKLFLVCCINMFLKKIILMLGRHAYVLLVGTIIVSDICRSFCTMSQCFAKEKALRKTKKRNALCDLQ